MLVKMRKKLQKKVQKGKDGSLNVKHENRKGKTNRDRERLAAMLRPLLDNLATRDAEGFEKQCSIAQNIWDFTPQHGIEEEISSPAAFRGNDRSEICTYCTEVRREMRRVICWHDNELLSKPEKLVI